MVAVRSTMLDLGSQAADFNLANQNNLYPSVRVALSDYINQPLVVAFICNHCPYVVLLNEMMSSCFQQYQKQGVAVVAISSNDAQHYPADSPSNMTMLAQKHAFTFAYLYDDTQSVAKSYRAACTPDFYLFNSHHQLCYRGQFDDARPGNGIEPSGCDLTAAVNQLINDGGVSENLMANQKPSMGCNIKWQSGSEPEYF